MFIKFHFKTHISYFFFFFSLNIFINFNYIFFFRAIAVGGADMTTKIYAIKKFKNLSVYTLGSHTDAVVGCFFEENSLNVSFIFIWKLLYFEISICLFIFFVLSYFCDPQCKIMLNFKMLQIILHYPVILNNFLL